MGEGWGQAPLDPKNAEFSWPIPSEKTPSTTQQQSQISFQQPQQSQNQFSQYQQQPSSFSQPSPQQPSSFSQPPPQPPPIISPTPPPPLQQQQSIAPSSPSSFVQQAQKPPVSVPPFQQQPQSKSPIQQPSLLMKNQDDRSFKNSIEQTGPSYPNNLTANNRPPNARTIYDDEKWDTNYDNVQSSSTTPSKLIQAPSANIINSHGSFASNTSQKEKSPVIQKSFNDASTQTDFDYVDLAIIKLLQQKYSFIVTMPDNKVIPPSKPNKFIDVYAQNQQSSQPYSPATSSSALNWNNDLSRDTSQSLIRFDDDNYQKSSQSTQQPPRKFSLQQQQQQQPPPPSTNKYNDDFLEPVKNDHGFISPLIPPVQPQQQVPPLKQSSTFGDDNQRNWNSNNISQQQQQQQPWDRTPANDNSNLTINNNRRGDWDNNNDLQPQQSSWKNDDRDGFSKPLQDEPPLTNQTWGTQPQPPPQQQQSPLPPPQQQPPIPPPQQLPPIPPPQQLPPIPPPQQQPPIPPPQQQQPPIPPPQQLPPISPPQQQPPIPPPQQQQLPPPQSQPVVTPAGEESWDNTIEEENWLSKAAKFEKELQVDPSSRIGVEDSTTTNKNYYATNNNNNDYGKSGSNRDYQNGPERPNAKTLWEQLLKADSEGDLAKFKRIFEEYTSAAPDETFQSIEKDLRAAHCKARIVALDQSHIFPMSSRSLVDLQGVHDKKYLAYITFDHPGKISPDIGVIAKSEVDNYELLAKAGLPKDDASVTRNNNYNNGYNNNSNYNNNNNNNNYNNNYGNLPTCYNCNQKGHVSRNCPEPRKDNNRPPLQQSSSASYGQTCQNCGSSDHPTKYCKEDRNSSGGHGNDYYTSRPYESRHGGGGGGGNMMGGGSNSSSQKKCFKCGSSDHIARFCNADNTSNSGTDYQQRRNYNNGSNSYGNGFGGSNAGGGYGGGGRSGGQSYNDNNFGGGNVGTNEGQTVDLDNVQKWWGK